MPDILLLVLTWILVLILDGCIIFFTRSFWVQEIEQLMSVSAAFGLHGNIDLFSTSFTLLCFVCGFGFCISGYRLSHRQPPVLLGAGDGATKVCVSCSQPSICSGKTHSPAYSVLSQAFAVVRHVAQHVLFSAKHLQW